MGIYDREYLRDEDQPTGLRMVFGNSAVNTLIAVNIAVYVADAIAGGDHWLSYLLSATPETLRQPWNWWKFLTYGFVHDPNHLNHILFNMFGLWCFGKTIEERYGKKEFLTFYLMAIVLGGIAWSSREYFTSISQVAQLTVDQFRARMLMPLLGASGAITAIVMLFVFLYPTRTVLLFMVIPAPAWVLGVILVAGNIFTNKLPGEGEGRIAYDVHLVGAAFAAAYFWFGWRLSSFVPSMGWMSSMPRGAKRLLRSKPDLRIHHPEDHESYREQDEQADRILAKLHEHGDSALTSQEKQILEDYSRRMRQKLR